MRIVAIAVVKDEIDVIEAFVRHTLAFVDRLVVLDNGSSDGTCVVLRALAAEGLPLDVIEDSSPGHHQAQRMSGLMHEWALQRHKADWVLPLDADEFVATAGNGPLVPRALEAPLALPWRSYVPELGDNLSELNPVLRIRHRLQKESCPWVKVLVPATLASRPGASLVQGSHDLLLGEVRYPWVSWSGAWLAHYPMRSPGQYLAKIAINQLQYAAMPNRRIDGGWHYRQPYELLRRDPGAFRNSFFQEARSYGSPPGAGAPAETTCEPLVYRGGPLRYTAPADDEARGWLKVLAFADDLARRQAALTACLDDDQHVSVKRLAAVLTAMHAHMDEAYRHLLDCDAQLRRATGHIREVRQQAAHQLRQAHKETVRNVEHALKQTWTWRAGRLMLSVGEPFGFLCRLFRHAFSRVVKV